MSLDHFFTSLNQYYLNLREENPTACEPSHVYRYHPRAISQQEVEGLSIVLQLITAIVQQVGGSIASSRRISAGVATSQYFFRFQILSSLFSFTR